MRNGPMGKGRPILNLVDVSGDDMGAGSDLFDRETGQEFGPVEVARGSSSVEAFESFYRREFPRLVVLARALTGSGAEDVAQEAMLAAYRRWDAISELASPIGYVHRICMHKAVSIARRRGVERRALLRLVGHIRVDFEPLPDDSERFWQEVRRLPRRQAQVVALFYAIDLPVAAVATTLDCADGTVKAHLSRARATLATRLDTRAEERT